MEELSGKEIAAIVEAPIKTVFSRLRLAREAFMMALTMRQRASNQTMRSARAPIMAPRGQTS